MKKKLLEVVNKWSKGYISSADVKIILNSSPNAIHSLLKRAVKEGLLVRLKRDFYLISRMAGLEKTNTFEIAALIYGPSYVSFESALSFYGWIPEAIPVTTCACVKRTKTFETPIGIFSFYNIPLSIFHVGVNANKTNGANFFVASPWKAIADLIYVKKRKWPNIIVLSNDMRIELDILQHSDLDLLKKLKDNYPNTRVRKVLQRLAKDLDL